MEIIIVSKSVYMDFDPYPPPKWKFFLNGFTLVSRIIEIDLPEAEFSPWAENLEA